MNIIDAHCHFHNPKWNLPDENNKEYLASYLEKDFKVTDILNNAMREGIFKTILFPIPSNRVDLEKANHYTVAISRRHPDQLIPFVIIDDKPEYWAANGVKGFKEHVYGQRIHRDHKGRITIPQDFKETYRYMEQFHFPLLLHAGENRVERLRDDIFRDTPNLIVILAHLGTDFPENRDYKPDPEQVKLTLSALKDLPTLYYDISAIQDPEILKFGLEIVGSKRLIFGSDFPFDTPGETLRRIKTLPNITADDLNNILYKNIQEILSTGEGAST